MLAQPLVVLSIALLAAAAPQANTSPCSTGSLQCCQSTEAAGSPTGAVLTTLLGIVVPDATMVLGVNCSPISAIGIGKSACSANTVCCSDNSVVSVPVHW
uniref:Hydrophobin n=1 Tax=Ganoderma boninense TaxID=34458 RepID=A0A5K1JVQ4_9APHY|nr:Vacuolar protein sorting-associated protein 27 [Ganoderma boninense]